MAGRDSMQDMKAINWENIREKYKGQWVALEDDEVTVVASGRSVREVLEKAKEEGHAEPIVAFMPRELVSFAGYEI